MKIVRIVCCLFLLLMGVVIISQPATLLAQDESPTEEKIELSTTYLKLEGTAIDYFQFTIEIKYQGSEVRYFDLEATGPKGWEIYITPVGELGTKIRSRRLEPGKKYPDSVNVIAYPPAWPSPEPGEYTITFEVSSGEISSSIELKAIITAMYSLGLAPVGGLYNTAVTAGKDNYFSIRVENRGTATINNINLSSDNPRGTVGWTVEFSQSEVDSLAAGDFQAIEVNIKPSSRTIAGDYYPLSLRASGDQATAERLEIRITVETPTIWGWVGVGIIVLVLAGLGVIFMRFSRR